MWQGKTAAGVPVSHCLLPSLQLGDLVHLEPEYPRPVPICLQRHARRTHTLPDAFCLWFFPHPPASPTTLDVSTPCQPKFDGSALRWDEVGVDEKEEVREGGPEVRAVDRAVAG